MMKIRDFIARHVLSHFSNKSTSGQAFRSPIRFVARSSADEWHNIIRYNRDQPGWHP